MSSPVNVPPIVPGAFATYSVPEEATALVHYVALGGQGAGFATSEVLLEARDAHSSTGTRVRLSFEGANRVVPVGRDPLTFRSNFFLGSDPARWRTNVLNYREIVYADLYDGIDLVYRQSDLGLKYEFIVAPYSNPGLIAVVYHGATAVRIDDDGNLIVETLAGPIRDSVPRSYEDSGRVISCTFVLRGPFAYGFECLGRDASRALVIDPIIFSTFLGGNNENDWGNSIAVDASGNVYVTGYTDSVDFPTTPAGFNTTFGGVADAFVVKLNASGDALVYATYIGGSDLDVGRSLVLAPDGSVYVAGETFSSDFPTTSGAFSTTKHLYNDAFVLRLGPDGDVLSFSTFLGGDVQDWGGTAIALDPEGAAYVVGSTDSPDFPTTPGAFRPNFGGGEDAYVSKLSANGDRLVYSTFLGGSAGDGAWAIVVDQSGNAFVVGSTSSANFPVTNESFSPAHHGDEDAFIVKLNSTGSGLLFGSYLGGALRDLAEGLAVDSAGNAVVTGLTESPDFPSTPGSFDPSYNGLGDGFVAKVNASGDSILYAGFLGGVDLDDGGNVLLDSSGNVYVFGDTTSSDFPVTPDALDSTFNGSQDLYVAEVGALGDRVLHATLLGGNGGLEAAGDLALDAAGNLYLTGWTSARDFPVTPGAFDTSFGGLVGLGDGFVVKLNFSAQSAPPPPTALVVGAVAIPAIGVPSALLYRTWRLGRVRAKSAERGPSPGEK